MSENQPDSSSSFDSSDSDSSSSSSSSSLSESYLKLAAFFKVNNNFSKNTKDTRTWLSCASEEPCPSSGESSSERTCRAVSADGDFRRSHRLSKNSLIIFFLNHDWLEVCKFKSGSDPP